MRTRTASHTSDILESNELPTLHSELFGPPGTYFTSIPAWVGGVLFG